MVHRSGRDDRRVLPRHGAVGRRGRVASLIGMEGGHSIGSSLAVLRQMHALGFAVLAIDYRGFGMSTDELPSEASVEEDAHVAWEWLAKRPLPVRWLVYYSACVILLIFARYGSAYDASSFIYGGF